jgi:hypothetical protein
MVVVRPRRWLVAVVVVAAVALPAGLLELAYDASYFDPRIAIVALYGVIAVPVALRTRIVVADGLFRRPIFRRGRDVRLDALASVHTLRHRLVIADAFGGVTFMRTRYWRNDAAPLLAVLAACTRAQGIAVDETLRRTLDDALGRCRGVVPAWAYRPAAPGAAAPPPPASTFWTRRDPDGTPRTSQPQRLIPLLLVVAVTVPLAIVLGTTGTHAVRSVRCGHDRVLWGARADVAATDNGIVPLLATVDRVTDAGTTPTMYRLRPSNLANSHNTPAVRADAAVLVDGFVTVWATGSNEHAEVQFERFPTHAAALAFQRDYAEDHCRGGDVAFRTPGIAGGVGFRTGCVRNCSNLFDRVAFVRGTIRVQAIVEHLRLRDSHDAAMRLARIADGTPAAQASTSRRPSRARPSVSSSAYSRSPPTGRPDAMRVTFTPSGLSRRARYIAVASPSMFGLVHRMTSVMPSGSRRSRSSFTFS